MNFAIFKVLLFFRNQLVYCILIKWLIRDIFGYIDLISEIIAK